VDAGQHKVHTLTGSPSLLMQEPSSGSRSVVLVHGIWDTARIFGPLCQCLKAGGFRPLAPDLTPSNGDLGLDQLALQVQRFVAERIPPHEQFDMVGFSMGGLVSRYYAQRLGGLERIGRLITISTPHRGTLWANAAGNPGSRQMRPNSAFLTDLNEDAAMLERIKFVSIWTPFDLMIVPASSSRLGVGAEFRIPVALHAWMPKNRRCMDLISKLLLENQPSPEVRSRP